MSANTPPVTCVIAHMFRPCECFECGEIFDAEPCLHDYVMPVCPECGSDEVKELKA